jgi:dethiobiotin synthetase
VRGLFVTGTDTGAGKTVLTGALLAAMVAAGVPVRPHKPVLTGLEEPPPGPWPADDELLAGLSGMTKEQVAPLRFGPPASPHLAAELAGEELDPDAIVAAVRALAEDDSYPVLVEGVGGLLVPLRHDYLVRDLVRALGLPVVIAARPGLGTINHTLLTLEAARGHGIEVAAVVLSGWPEAPTAIERSNRDTIAAIGEVDVFTLPTLSGPDPAALARAGGQLPWREWLAGR